MEGNKFIEAVAKLNPRQREAVEAIEGPVMVVAGPGTGKTQILTLRIANILAKTDTAPEQILALTFTESGVASMRKRLAEMIGSSAYAVNINTFHGWGNEVIKKYPEDFPRIIGSKNIHEVEQIEILEELVEELPLKLLRPFGDKFLYVKPLRGAIEELKREGLTPAEFKNILAVEEKKEIDWKRKSDELKYQRQLAKNKELSLVYEKYEERLALAKLYDFSDMIMEVLRGLKEEQELLQILQEEHQYVLVDEHQDTNNAQNKIIERLMSYHQSPNLFVVGDEKQAIYRFQGASLENFTYFKRAYTEAKLIILEDNYRSQQTILDSAYSLLEGAKLSAKSNQELKPIKIYAFDQAEEEAYWLAQILKEKIESGVEPSELAVLYRDNRDAFPLARMLEKLAVPFTIESDQDLLSQKDVRQLITLLTTLSHFGEDEYLAPTLLLPFWGADPLLVYGVLRQSYEEKKHLWTLIKNDPDLKVIYNQLKEWHTWCQEDDLLTLFEKLVRATVLANILISPEAEDRFEAVRRLYAEVGTLVEAKPEATLADFFKYLETVKTHALFIKRAKLGGRKGKVRLMTAHRSKGLEFNEVFIVGAHDGHWGGKKTRELLKLIPSVYNQSDADLSAEAGAEADERRLFYVALTRARQEVHISFSKIGDKGREQLPSQFITEIKTELKEDVETSTWQEKYKNNKEIIFSSTETAKEHSLHDQEFVREIFLKQGLSVSALNNYLECPWKYFYRNLVRLPEAQNKIQLYGIAIHAALADAFRLIKERDITTESLLASFEVHLGKLPLSKNDFTEVLAKGREALGGWWETYHESWERNVLTEFRIAGILLTPDIKLTGVLDKLEFTGSGKEVRVVDYKTKQPMSRNAIMGETKTDDDGNYFRQLVFYKLLLDKYENGKYLMKEGVIDFIEPNDTGRYKQESFEITPANVVELEGVIKQAAEEILNLTFWDQRCDDKKCEYCALRELMK